MPKGPKGERRPADTVQSAIKVARIATGEEAEDRGSAPERAKGGKIGGKARAQALSAKQRKEIAKKAARARWKSSSK